jgi:hypothetical protein
VTVRQVGYGYVSSEVYGGRYVDDSARCRLHQKIWINSDENITKYFNALKKKNLIKSVCRQNGSNFE